MDSIIPIDQTAGTLAQILDCAADYATASRADNTKRAYRADWQSFTDWCAAHRVDPLPALPATVAAYLTDQADAGRKAATLDRRLVAISQAHKFAGYPSPTTDERVRSVLKGIKRTKGTAQEQKAPIVIDTLRALVDVLPDSTAGTRDRALLLVGFAGAFRRSELVSLDVEDLNFTSAGVVITLKRSKTDQEGQGNKKAIPYGKTDTCPVRALKTWLVKSGITRGPIFRGIDRHLNIKAERLSGEAVRLIVKKAVGAAGLPEDLYAVIAYALDLPQVRQQRASPSGSLCNRQGTRPNGWYGATFVRESFSRRTQREALVYKKSVERMAQGSENLALHRIL